MQYPEATTAARTTIQALVNGEEPSLLPPETYGDWAPVVADLAGAAIEGGTPAVRRLFTALCRAHSGLSQLLASDPTPQEASLAAPGIAPALPAAAAAILEHQAPCGRWLDDYIAFAQAAAPMTPRSFHEAAGLFALSVALGRRVLLRYGIGAFYPNLYLLWIGPSTVYRKSTALRVLHGLLRRSGVNLALISEDLTPEALLQDMSTSIPATLPHWSAGERERWLRQRGIASQRALLLDEASFLFSGLHREYKEGLLGLLLKIYDCPDEISGQTISRGRVNIPEPSLAFFGVSTPKAMEEHLRNELLWANGLWRRFALIVPDRAPLYDELDGPDEYPPALVHDLERIYQLVPMPSAALVETEEGTRTVALHGGSAPTSVLLDDGVLDAWKAYTRATSFDLVVRGVVDESLHPSYGHLGTQVIKVAMLLAAADTEVLPIRVGKPHLARAVAIVEQWRSALHQTWQEGIATEEARISERMMAMLNEAGHAGLTVRDFCRALHRPAKAIREALDPLQKAGAIVCQTCTTSAGRSSERWVRL